ncbi:MAG TPA: hypothetical protein VF556_08715 [Pyrinomonadaceae bacterium]|jgi:hypothetical protein
MSELEFFYDGNEVGCFEESEYPLKNGKYRYMPYRGEGHYRMQTAINNSTFPRCYYDKDKERIFFTVIDCPEYGILELATFERTSKAN